MLEIIANHVRISQVLEDPYMATEELAAPGPETQVQPLSPEDLVRDYAAEQYAEPDEAVAIQPPSIEDPEVEYSMADPKEIIQTSMSYTDPATGRQIEGTPIAINYTTIKGKSVGWRKVQPHYIYRSTGDLSLDRPSREILVSFDETVNDIRAFDISNISPGIYIYRAENFTMNPRIGVGYTI